MTTSFKYRKAYVAIALLVSLPLVSCAGLPPESRTLPDTVLPAAFGGAGGVAAAPAQWWTTFDSPELNTLIAEALGKSLTLQSAWDRLDQARATARIRGADDYPSLTGSGGAARSVNKTRGAGSVHASDFSVGLSASYEVDLWGRVRSARQAAELDLAATEQDLHAAAMTLTAELADTWCQLIEQRARLKLLDAQIKTSQDHLDMITLKYVSGQTGVTDVLQQRQLLEAAQGLKVRVESDAEVSQQRIAVLLGRAPGTFAPQVDTALPALPPLPASGVPAALVQRRPDVLSAWLRVRSADQRTAAAVADRFPKFSLSSNADTGAGRADDLFENWAARIAANLTAPLLDGGRRSAEVDRTRAVASAAFHAYGQKVLEALADVERALSREAHQQQYVQSLRKQVALSRQSTDQTRDNYTKGAADFTRFLTTLIAHYQLEQSLVQADAQLIRHRIDLYRALGGSWDLQRKITTPKGADND
jgi:outer membrane protein, multidrug efflux system